MKLEKIKADFQVTGWVSEVPPKNQITRRLVSVLDGKYEEKDLSKVVECLYSSKESRLACLTDYFNNKYGRITSDSQISELEKSGFEIYPLSFSQRKKYISVRKKSLTEENAWLTILHGQEIFTDKGHLIIAGISENYGLGKSHVFSGPKFTDALLFGEDRGALIIAPHPFDSSRINKLGLELMKKLGKKDPSYPYFGLSEETLEEYLERIDAIEVSSSSMSKSQTKKAREFSDRTGIPLVANSDGNLEQAFSPYNEIEKAFITTPEALLNSLRSALQHRHNHCQPVLGKSSSLAEKAEHLAMNLLQTRDYF